MKYNVFKTVKKLLILPIICNNITFLVRTCKQFIYFILSLEPKMVQVITRHIFIKVSLLWQKNLSID